jgi:hypothetical protein
MLDNSVYDGGWETPDQSPIDLDFELMKHRHKFMMHKYRFKIAARLISEGKTEEYEDHLDTYFSVEDLDQLINRLINRL